jgi:thioester reductase-like protein
MNARSTHGSPHILLTGATGLLGSYLVRDLLLAGRSVAVIARSERKRSPAARVEALVADWEMRLGVRLPRPVVLAGDLTQPACGLDGAGLRWVGEHCSELLHNAASLSFKGTSRDEEPWVTNVGGTAHVLELAARAGLRRMHQVSTAYVCGLRTDVVAEADLDVGQSFGNDYERSKVEAERLVRSAGHLDSVTVYRPSIIVGDSVTGYTSTYHGFFAALRLGHTLLTRVPLGSTSGLALLALMGVDPAARKNFVPVDWVARVIATLVGRPEAHGRTFHVTHPDPLPTGTVAATIQEAVETYSRAAAADDPDPQDERWFADNLSSELDVYQRYFRHDPVFDRANILAHAGDLPCPPLDRETLLRMARFAIEHEFGRRPAGRGGQVAALRLHPSLPGVVSGAGDATRPLEAAPLDARLA